MQIKDVYFWWDQESLFQKVRNGTWGPRAVHFRASVYIRGVSYWATYGGRRLFNP